MPEFATTPPIPYVPIGDQAAAVRSAINVYSKLETYSQAEVGDLFYSMFPDDDAIAYVNAIETELGTSIATALPNAVNAKYSIYNFIKLEKAASRWTSHKRIYLPIYNNSAASAVDMVSRLSGTFTGIGSVTHAAGYVQGDGTSGYFDSGFIPSSSMAAGSASMAVLVKSTQSRDAFRCLAGVQNTIGPKLLRIGTTATNLLAAGFTNTAPPAFSFSLADATGILISNFTSGNNTFSQRKTAGFSALSSNSTTNTQAPATSSVYMLAQNADGSAGSFSNAQIGAFTISNGLASPADFTLNLKTLWESLTGLTLP